MNIAFIGLGNMGSAMAGNLLKAGHALSVFNRTRSRAEALPGARVADTPAQAVAGAEVLVTMLADDAAVEQVLWGQGGALEALAQGAVHISMSTISVALSERLNQTHRHKGHRYVAATVFGRPDAAAAAQLFILAAGPAEELRRCQPLFDAMGQKTFVVGPDPVSANVVKLAGNFLLTAVIEGLAEASALVRKHGVEPQVFQEILTGSLFGAPAYRNYGAMIAAGRFEPVGFKLPLGMKDNRLLLAAAEKAAVPMPMASVIRDRFVAAMAQGWAEADWAAIARVSFQAAGLEK